MNKIFSALAISLIAMASCTPARDSRMDFCVSQVKTALEHLDADYTQSPRNIAPGDTVWSCREVSRECWTEGFWPGILWYAYEASQDKTIGEVARNYTEALEFIAHSKAYDHDLGFIMFPSFGNAYRITGEQKYKDILLETAGQLSELYNPAVGTILSWPREVDNFGGHNTIMDNLINLELLFWAAENGGDPNWKDIAISHADKTMENNFRPDGTSYHVAVYDPLSGRHLYSCTHQGFADDSMWARGQAWGIYGYTMCYRFTKDEKYLDFACRISDAYLERLPEDLVPYWDFDAPCIPQEPKDASAAAIVASALIELSSYIPGEKGANYMETARKIVDSLSSNYCGAGTNDSFLLHSTGHKPNGSEVDYSIIYADYYYIEALHRLQVSK